MTKRRVFIVLGLLSFIYSIMVFLVGSGTYSYMIWLIATLFFVFMFIMDRFNGWKVVPKSVKRILIALISLGLIVFLICQACILSKFFSKGEKDLDYIIVLGAQMKDWGPSVVYKHRLDAAIEYLNENPDTLCVVTGGQGSNESISEGEGGRDYLFENGISEERILLENKSVDTKENISNAFKIIGIHEKDIDALNIGIVTNNFHVYRGCYIASKETDANISGIAAYTEYRFLPNNMVRETFGILKDCIK